jgi:hypothetical protein
VNLHNAQVPPTVRTWVKWELIPSKYSAAETNCMKLEPGFSRPDVIMEKSLLYWSSIMKKLNRSNK